MIKELYSNLANCFLKKIQISEKQIILITHKLYDIILFKYYLNNISNNIKFKLNNIIIKKNKKRFKLIIVL